MKIFLIFLEHLYVVILKNVRQKQRIAREFWKGAFFIPFFLLLFTTYIIYSSIAPLTYAKVYQLFSLPPLSKSGGFGVFNPDGAGNTENTLISTNLYYTPNDHAGSNPNPTLYNQP